MFEPVSDGHTRDSWVWPRTWAGEGTPGSSGSTCRRTRTAGDARGGPADSPRSGEARRALARAKVDIDAGRLRHGPRRTVADLAAEWLEAVQPNRKASTFSNYGWLMRAYVLPRIGRIRLDRLSPTDVQKLYCELRASGGREGAPLTGTQVRNIHRVLHNALNYAVRLGYIARNPTEAGRQATRGHRGATGLHARADPPLHRRHGRRSTPSDVVSGVGDRVTTGRIGWSEVAGRSPGSRSADAGCPCDADHRGPRRH